MSIATVGLLYHPSVPAARTLAEELCGLAANHAGNAWTSSAWDEDALTRMETTDLLVCVGGDGTMLRGARTVIPHPIPILGVNMGRLGFLSELSPEEAAAGLTAVIAGAGRIERRTMLRAGVSLPGGAAAPGLVCQDVLNDVVLGRAGGRPVYIQVLVDGVEMDIVRADGVVVSTATGSTGYNLSAGGPALAPESEELVLTSIAAHLAHVPPLVLPGDTAVTLRIQSDVRAVVSFDGQVDYPVVSGMTVHIRRGPHVARLIRLGPPSDFFRNLTQLLNLSRGSS